MTYAYLEMDSPVGRLKLVAHEQALLAVLWQNEQPKRVPLHNLQLDTSHPILLKTQQQLNEYFNAQRQVFDLPLEFHGTEFQKKFGKHC